MCCVENRIFASCIFNNFSKISYVLFYAFAVIIVVNKWDLLRRTTSAKTEYENHIREQLRFMDYVPIEFISATTGYRVSKLMDLALHVYTERAFRFKTRQIMDIIRVASARHLPPSKRGRYLKIKYVTQANLFPPTFIFWINDLALMHFTYERYLENLIREHHAYVGTPLRLIFLVEVHVLFLSSG
jgi:GTP-binding protein